MLWILRLPFDVFLTVDGTRTTWKYINVLFSNTIDPWLRQPNMLVEWETTDMEMWIVKEEESSR